MNDQKYLFDVNSILLIENDEVAGQKQTAISCYIHELHAGWIGFSHASYGPICHPNSLVLLTKHPKPAASGKSLTSLKVGMLVGSNMDGYETYI